MDIGYVFKIIIYSQNQNIEMRHEAVIRSLILYLGEKEEELFEDCQVKCVLFNVMLKLYYHNVHQGWGTNVLLNLTRCKIGLTQFSVIYSVLLQFRFFSKMDVI